MKITFDNALYTGTDYKITQQGPQNIAANAAGGHALDISDSRSMSAYCFGKSKGLHGLSKEDMLQALGGQDMALYRNYMTVMSNTMSDEDFARMQEEGYHPMELHPEEASNILDSIKAELIKAGVDIEGYTDTIDKEVLADITGSVTYANRLLDSFAQEDVPLTVQNAKEAMEAVNRGLELTEMSEGALKFLLTNVMDPTIDNLYLAEHAGAKDAGKQAKGYFTEELPGYLAKTAGAEETRALQEQIEKIIEKAGFEVNEETVNEGFWLVEKGIPATEDSFRLLHDMRGLSLPASEDKICNAVAAAMAEGKPASSADLRVEKSIYRRAADFYSAHRSMEEIRLHMTVEANLKLLKSGFSIDTTPIEETIQALKDLEEKQTVGQNAGDMDLCKETMAKVREIPYLPAAATGRILFYGEKLTIDTLYETGKQLQEEFRKANEAYETMFTEIRADLGDSMKKAFRSVDNLLTNLGIDLTAENRKAARSLSYNQMELTPENIRRVKEAEAAVMKVVKKMTPMSVLQMIRDKINPLQASLEELEEYFASYDSYSEDSEKYSRFLYRMEQNGEITAEEKQSFIGVYRLLHQLEKSDGAAVGKLVDTGAELNFKNLLSAVRTGKVHGINITVDREFGGIAESVSAGISIDAQIDSAYNKDLLQEIRGMDKADNQIFELLNKLEEPVTLENVMALKGIRDQAADSYKRVKRYEADRAETESGEEVLPEPDEEDFADRDGLQTGYQEMLERSEVFLREKTFEAGESSLDVRSMRLSCKQFSLQRKLAVREEEYQIPLMVKDEVMAVHFKFVHDTGEKGSFAFSLEDEKYGHISGQFTMKEDVLSGYFAIDTEETDILLQTKEIFADKLDRAGIKAGDIQVITGRSEAYALNGSETKTETGKLYRAAGIALYALKESFQQ